MNQDSLRLKLISVSISFESQFLDLINNKQIVGLGNHLWYTNQQECKRKKCYVQNIELSDGP